MSPLNVGEKKYFEAQESHPYHSNNDLVGWLKSLETKIFAQQKQEPITGSNDAIVDGISQEVNWLKEELNKAWARIIVLENANANAHPLSATGASTTSAPEAPTP